MNKIDPKRLTSIDDDFALWAAEQAALVRAGKFDRVDIENVVEELESLGRGERYEIRSRMEVLIQHLLNWEYQPEKRSNSWKATIAEQRVRIARIIRESPSLKSYPAKEIGGSFIIGKNDAITQTGLPETAFPDVCVYTVEQILDPMFFPGPASEL